MFPNFSHVARSGSWPALILALGALCCTAPAASAQPLGITMLQADDQPAHAEFVRQLQTTQPAGSRLVLVRLGAGGNDAAPPGDDDRVNTAVRTRSMRPTATADTITIAVGPDAARAASG
ncbi:MAG: hypothetical protein EOO24_60630, partial [Comamonadaceae bacterium]